VRRRHRADELAELERARPVVELELEQRTEGARRHRAARAAAIAGARLERGVAVRRLEPGMVGPEVDAWQRVLCVLRVTPTLLRPDKFGPDTTAATKAFQKSRGIVESGAVDAATSRIAAVELAELAALLVTPGS